MIQVTQIDQQVDLTVNPTTEVINIEVTEVKKPVFIVSENEPENPTINQNNIPLKVEIVSNALPTNDIAGFVTYFNALNPNLVVSEITSLVQFYLTDTNEIYQLAGIGKGTYGLGQTQITSQNVLKYEINPTVDLSDLTPRGGYNGTAQDLADAIDAIPTFTPSDYDLDEFTNESADPFVRASELPSGAFLPLSGGTMTGDIEFEADAVNNLKQINSSVTKQITFEDDSTFNIRVTDNVNFNRTIFGLSTGEVVILVVDVENGFSNVVQFFQDQIYISANNPDFLGFLGNAVFNKLNDPNSFAQLGDIATTNATATPLTVGTLNSTYPTQPTGFKVICPNISTIYVKTSLNTWYTVTSGVGASTNLSNTPTPTGIALGSSTGTGTTLPLADATNAGLLSPAEKTTISALPLIIADATPSALVTTSAVSTIVKTYNIGALNGRKILKFNVRVVRTLTGANARVTVSLRDTVTNIIVTVNLAQTLNTARTIFNLRREIPLDQTAGVMRIMPFSTNTDDGEFTTPLTNQAINFTNPLELRVELLDSSASVSIQTYQTLIELI